MKFSLVVKIVIIFAHQANKHHYVCILIVINTILVCNYYICQTLIIFLCILYILIILMTFHLTFSRIHRTIFNKYGFLQFRKGD